MTALLWLWHWFVVTCALTAALFGAVAWVIVRDVRRHRALADAELESTLRSLTAEGFFELRRDKRRGIAHPLPKERRAA